MKNLVSEKLLSLQFVVLQQFIVKQTFIIIDYYHYLTLVFLKISHL